MRRIKKILIIFIFLLSTIFTTGCIFVRETLEDKIDFEGFWKCEEYNLTLDLLVGTAYKITNNETYYYRIVFGDAGNSICFYDDLYSIKEWDNCAYGEDMLFNCVPNISIKKDSFTLKIGDCKKEEFANKTLKFIHITKKELLKDNEIYERIKNNSKWIDTTNNINLIFSNESNIGDKFVINGVEYLPILLQDCRKIEIANRRINDQIEYGLYAILDLEKCEEDIKMKVDYSHDETILEVGKEIILKVDNNE